jgi:acetyl-CoA carboxylase biotin carboxyl carrier protein
MDLNYVKKLVKLLSESDVDEIEIEEEGKKIRVAKNPAPPPVYQGPQVMTAPHAHAVTHALTAGQVSAGETSPAAPPAAVPAPANVHEIKSPIVGTFYRSPSPDASPFVQVGSAIQSGTVLCIVEAMKLMNEIESDVSGKIVKIMVENGQPVEYDQVLFLVEKE